MSAQLGIVTLVNGSATVTRLQGTTEDITLNTTIFEGDTISTLSPDTKVIIETAREPIEINGASTVSVPLYSSAFNTDNSATNDAASQIEEIRQATQLSQEFDPNQLEPTAAGVEESGTNVDANLNNAPIIDNLLEMTRINAETLAQNSTNQTQTESENFASQTSLASPINLSDDSILAFENTRQSDNSFTLSPINITEDTTIIRSGSLPGQGSTAALVETQYGELAINEEGDWQYQLNNQLESVQQLGAGDSLSEMVRFEVGNASYQVLVNIHGSNDSANISGDTKGRLTEGGLDEGSVSGKLSITDADSGEARFKPVDSQETAYGRVSVDVDGQWHYTLDQESTALQSLRQTDQVFDSFAATSLDGSSEIIRITIDGTNDVPVFSGSNQSSIYVDDALETGGKLLIQDADFGESRFVEANNLVGEFGQGSIDAHGNWNYLLNDADSRINALNDGDRLFDQFSVSSLDGTVQNIIISISGGSETGLIADTTALEDDELALQQLTFADLAIDGSELYIWSAPDQGSGTETINHFNPGIEGDRLIIGEVLSIPDRADAETLSEYLDFEVGTQGTTLHINPQGAESEVSHDLLLNGFDAGQYGNSNSEIIHNLMQSGSLEIAHLS